MNKDHGKIQPPVPPPPQPPPQPQPQPQPAQPAHHHHHHNEHEHEHHSHHPPPTQEIIDEDLAVVKHDLAVIELNSVFWKAAHVSYHDNLVLSPMNVSFLMALMRLGCRGNTYREIVTTMKFHDEQLMVDECYLLIESMKSDPNLGIEMTISKAIFIPIYCTFKKDIVELANEKFSTDILQVDFSVPDDAAQIINDWTEKSSNSKIREIISKEVLSSDTHLVIANTLYFKGQWNIKFPKENTKKDHFFATGGKKVDVDMMRNSIACPYADIPQLKAKAIALPYRGGQYSLVIVLPEKRYGLSEVEKRLDSKFSGTIHNQLTVRPYTLIDVHLPKFKIVSTDNVKSIFERIGMKSIFQDNAELNGCFEKVERHEKKENAAKIHVSHLIQKICMELDEEGGNGNDLPWNHVHAAVNTASLALPSAPADASTQSIEIIPFIVDHPFLYYLMDLKYETTIFIGVQAKFDPE